MIAAHATGDLFVYVVDSSEGGQPYTVDLLANNGVGGCDCPSFLFRCVPKIALGEKVSCKHVAVARQRLAEDIITRQVELNAALEIKRGATPYEVVRDEFIKANPRCGVCGMNITQDVHHSRGRLGSLLADVRFFVPVCRPCHTWIDANRNAARELSWKGIPVLCALGDWNRSVDEPEVQV